LVFRCLAELNHWRISVSTIQLPLHFLAQGLAIDAARHSGL
jgi:hypothetical protein